jgi:hypothetical protein
MINPVFWFIYSIPLIAAVFVITYDFIKNRKK